MPFIKTLIEKGYVTPAFGRFLEVAVVSAVAAALVELLTQLSSPAAAIVDYKAVFNVGLAAFMAYALKAARDIQKKAQEAE